MSRQIDMRFRPDYAISPGDTLRETLAEIGMSQADLADRANLSPKHVNQIIHGLAPITHETALAFERITGVPARVWNALEAAYRDSLARQAQRDLSLADRAWLRELPIRELRAKGLLEKEPTEGATFESVLRFFGVADRRAWERLWLQPVASFKRSRAFQSEPGAVAAWLRAGQLQAQVLECEAFDSGRFRRIIRDARTWTRRGDFGELLQQSCATAGVAVVYVPEVGKCRASGAAHWATPSKAIIQISDRYKKQDSFWFAFFHEAAHILHHSKKETFINDGSEDSAVEAEANQFAQSTLIPSEFESELDSLVTSNDVIAFANRIGIHPGIVAGRLANDGIAGWTWPKVGRLRSGLRIV
jgi:HTH-type transcriptional regulator/antitoxin HigA